MEKVLASIDFSDLSAVVVEQAAEIAKETSSELWLLHVAPPEPDFAGHQLLRKVVEDEVPEKLAEEDAKLRAIEQELSQGGLRVRRRLVRGEPVECILAEARILGADLIVLGSHGRGPLYRTFVGSVCEGVLRGATCPLVIIPQSTARPEPAPTRRTRRP